MRFPPALLIAAALACAVPATSAAAETGGAIAPSSPSGDAGGATYDRSIPPTKQRARHRRRRRGPVLVSFELKRPRLFLYGRPARVTFRMKGRGPVDVRLRLVPAGQRRAVATIPLGKRPTGSLQSYLLTGQEAGILPQGRYVLGIAGRNLRRAPSASSSAELSFFHHRFPIVGSFGWGGPDARFGAARRGHTHQGQDLPAAEGTPIVAPRGGVIQTVAYQAGGAGNYAVLDGDTEDRDYVFMHMRTGSVVVKPGQHVRTGQRIGEVGNTGESFGPHLHFEVWVGGWQIGRPIDPLPMLRAWASWS